MIGLHCYRICCTVSLQSLFADSGVGVGVFGSGVAVNFYRSASQGSEIDLLLTAKDRKPWAIEIKRSDTPKLERGFHLACQDVLPEAKFVVYPGTEQFPLRYNVRAIGLRELCELVAEL